jgi:peptidoglycan-N-acetylglucosamine deacetylase
MTWGWNWDGEDEQRPVPSAAPTPPDTPQLASRVRVRRRRLGAGAVVLALLLLTVILTTLTGSDHQRPQTSSRLRTDPQRAAADGASTPHAGQSDPVADVLAYTPFVKQGGARGRDVALTFDDGPGPYTPGVLSVLERYDVHATFFAIGAMEQYFSTSTVRELRDGDVVGDHTETHPEMALLSAHAQHEELFEQIARIELLGGPRPQLFRPPYGSFSATTMRELHSLHLLMVLWSVDTGDYLQPGVAVIVQRVLAGAHPGAIILLHDAGGDRSQTIAALPAIIEGLRARGFHLVTVPQLLADDPPPAGEPLPPNLSGD